MIAGRARSNIKTGDLIEQAAERSLVADGWRVHRTRRVKFQQNDIFGVFDLLGLIPGDGSVLLVQTTEATNARARKRKVEGWARGIFGHGWSSTTVQVWAFGEWPNGTGFRVWTYAGGRDWERNAATRPARLPP